MSSTKTQQPYFPHYANSRNDDNMISLRMAHGVAGYGVYHMLLERLRLSENYQCNLDYEILCWDLDCDQELIRSVIYDFGLFEIVCEGQKFQSVELNAYMQLMEEKKRERSERGRNGAAARWGLSIENVKKSDERNEVESMKPVPETETPESLERDTERLDKEIEVIENDVRWLNEMSSESGKSIDEIKSYIKDFKKMCILRGLKQGHKDMKDAFSHLRSWIYKTGRAKDPNSSNLQQNFRKSRGRHNEQEYQALRDKEREERKARYEEMEKNKGSLQDLVRRLGYDPKELGKDCINVLNPGWRAKNPPTHPEWIDQTVYSEPEKVEVPY